MEHASMKRISMSASDLRACLPEGTAPDGAKASNQFSALDPRRTDINVKEIICRGPPWHECSSHVHEHKYYVFSACSWFLTQ